MTKRTGSAPKPRDPGQTREALLRAGTEMFSRLGYDGARVDAIARRAGVNKAMISYHFHGKRGLYEAILEDTLGSVEDRLAALRSSGGPPDELLRRFVGTFVETVTARPEFPAMMARELLAGGERISPETLQKIAAVFRTVEEIVRRGAEDGTFRPVDPLLTHLSLVGTLVFFFATAPARARIVSRTGIAPEGREPDPESYARHVEDLFVRGLAGDPGRPRSDTPGDSDA